MATYVDGNMQTSFYPLGNTPACSLTQNLPADNDVNILSLGCGDIRNPLFTSHWEPNRKIDITCVDHNPAIIARNVLMLSLILDDKYEWEMYYHYKISDRSLDIIRQQAEKLCTTPQLDGKVQILDAGTLKKVQEIWKDYKSDPDLEHALYLRNTRLSDDHFAVSGARAATPYPFAALDDMPELQNNFWKHGTVDGNPDAKHLNPLFHASAPMFYETDPLSGFHLSVGYIPIKNGVQGPLAAAKKEFDQWAKSFQKSLTSVKYCWADALSFCLASQSCPAYRTSYTMDLLDSIKRDFDLIDTSDLADNPGTINLLIVASSLLKPNGLLRTDLLLRGDQPTEVLADLLAGELHLMSSLLGLTLLEYGTGASPSSTIDTLSLHYISKVKDNSLSDSEMWLRFTWKAVSSLKIDAKEFADTLYSIYQSMFIREHKSRIFKTPTNDPSSIKKHVEQLGVARHCMHLHRGSFAHFLRAVRNCSTDWRVTVHRLVELIQADENLLSSWLNLQELYVWLCRLGLCRIQIIDNPLELHVLSGDKQDFWSSLPGIVWITLKVPRSSFQPVASPREGLYSVVVHGLVASAARKSENFFNSLQLTFGEVQKTGSGRDLRIKLVEHARGIASEAPALVSFQVPTWTLVAEREETVIGLCAQRNELTAEHIKTRLGIGFDLFTAKLGDSSNVFLTTDPPNNPDKDLTTYPEYLSRSDSNIKGKVVNNKLDHVLLRLDITSEEQKRALRAGAAVSLYQVTPWEYQLDLIDSKRFRHQVQFPIPSSITSCSIDMNKENATLDLKASPLSAKERHHLPPFPVKVVAGGLELLNSHRMRLNTLPVIDLDGKMDWSDSHISYCFSATEQQDRLMSSIVDKTPNPRLAFKSSVASMFPTTNMVQRMAGYVKVFMLTNDSPLVDTTYILIDKVRLDISSGTMILDVAILSVIRTLAEEIMSTWRHFEGLRMGRIKVSDQELTVWKQVIPTFIERCRTWQHTETCRYPKETRVPLSHIPGEQFYCTCGNGKFPKGYLKDHPDFPKLAKYCTRAAISPCFGIPYIEDMIPTGMLEALRDGSNMCFNCEKSGDDTPLKKCGRCHAVKYCSSECQKQDWPKHKKNCKKE